MTTVSTRSLDNLMADRYRVRTSTLALVAVLATSVLAPATHAEASAMVPRAKVHTVALLGDSLTVGAAEIGDAGDDLDALGYDLLWVDAEVGRHTDAGVKALAKRKRKLPDLLVVGLGTNDVPSKLSATTYTASIDELLDIVGPDRPVVWLNSAVTRNKTETTRNGALNDALLAVARRRSNLVVADWASLIAQFPDLLNGDEIHLDSTGYRLRARYIAYLVDAVGHATT